MLNISNSKSERKSILFVSANTSFTISSNFFGIAIFVSFLNCIFALPFSRINKYQVKHNDDIFGGKVNDFCIEYSIDESRTFTFVTNDLSIFTQVEIIAQIHIHDELNSELMSVLT